MKRQLLKLLSHKIKDVTSTLSDSYAWLPPCEHKIRIQEYFGNSLRVKQPACDPIKRCVIICFTNRSGSTLAISQLSAHALAGSPNRYLNYEYLNENFVTRECNKFKIKTFSEYIAHIYDRHRSSSDVFTLKASLSQLGLLFEAGIIGGLIPHPVVIHVKRNNIIAQAVSWAIAQQTQRWTSAHKAHNEVEPQFNIQKIMACAKQITRDNALLDLFFLLHKVKPLTFFYEEFRDDPDLIPRNVARELDINLMPPTHPSLDIKRQATSQNKIWEERVLNAFPHLCQ